MKPSERLFKYFTSFNAMKPKRTEWLAELRYLQNQCLQHAVISESTLPVAELAIGQHAWVQHQWHEHSEKFWMLIWIYGDSRENDSRLITVCTSHEDFCDELLLLDPNTTCYPIPVPNKNADGIEWELSENTKAELTKIFNNETNEI